MFCAAQRHCPTWSRSQALLCGLSGLCGLSCCGAAAAFGCSMLVAGVVSLPVVSHAQPSCKDKLRSQQCIPSDTNKLERSLKNGTCQQGISKVMTRTSVSVPRGNPQLFLPRLPAAVSRLVRGSPSPMVRSFLFRCFVQWFSG